MPDSVPKSTQLIVTQLVKKLSKGSLPHTQDYTMRPYTEPPESTHNTHISFIKIHLNIILSSMPRCLKWSLQFMLSNWKAVCAFYSSHVCYMPYPSHSPCIWRAQIMRPLTINCLHPSTNSPLWFELFTSPCSHPQSMFFPHNETKVDAHIKLDSCIF